MEQISIIREFPSFYLLFPPHLGKIGLGMVEHWAPRAKLRFDGPKPDRQHRVLCL